MGEYLNRFRWLTLRTKMHKMKYNTENVGKNIDVEKHSENENQRQSNENKKKNERNETKR